MISYHISATARAYRRLSVDIRSGPGRVSAAAVGSPPGPDGQVSWRTYSRASNNTTTTTATATRQTDPTVTSSQRGCRLIHEVHLVICRRTKVATALAHGNSVAQIANPRKITNQPGPGIIKKTIPVTTTARPTNAIPIRHMW
jgi:hypothetical protein